MIKKHRFYAMVILLLITPAVFIGSNTQKISTQPDMKVGNRHEVSQYGITWTFDKSVKTGQFITGDWWVIGPVKVVKITPSPGPVNKDNTPIVLNHWGDSSLNIDTTMRNGSMIVLKVGPTQGYDSRNLSYSKSNTIVLPFDLTPNLSLISSISNTTLPVDNFCKNIMWGSEIK